MQPRTKLFIMQERHLDPYQVEQQPGYAKGVYKGAIARELTKDYELAMLKATIIALGGTVQTIAHTPPRSNDKQHAPMFTRDPLVVLADRKTILYPGYTYGSKLNEEALAIKNVIPENLGFQFVQVPKAYFEGGNVFYLADKSILLHGMKPIGFYDKWADIEPTNKAITAISGIPVIGIYLSNKIDEFKRAYNYYHLDCFMQTLPDGRLIILNKELICEKSRATLETLLDNKFIDLAYPDSDKSPVLFNFLTIETSTGLAIISPELPTLIKQKLIQLGLRVVTPSMLDSRNEAYDKNLAERVAQALNDEGFTTARADNLFTHLPKNSKGYLLSNGKRKEADLLDEATEGWDKNDNPLPFNDEHYAQMDRSKCFLYGDAGPHCLALDVDYSPQVTLQHSPRLFHPQVATQSSSVCFQPKSP